MVISTLTLSSILMEEICLAISGLCRSLSCVWILIWNQSQILELSPQGESFFLVVILRVLVGIRTRSYTLRFFPFGALIRSVHTFSKDLTLQLVGVILILWIVSSGSTGVFLYLQKPWLWLWGFLQASSLAGLGESKQWVRELEQVTPGSAAAAAEFSSKSWGCFKWIYIFCPFPHILDLALENLLALLPLLALHTSACGKPASTIVQADTYSFKARVLNQVFFGGWGCASSVNLKNGLILTSRRYSEWFALTWFVKVLCCSMSICTNLYLC